MKIVMYSHTGAKNHGCEALVRSTVDLLGDGMQLFSTGIEEDKACNLDAIVSLKEDIGEDFSKKISLEYLFAALKMKLQEDSILFTKKYHKKLIDSVEKGDICLSIGGDNYCYAGTEILGDLNRLLKKKGAKTVLWGCSIDGESLTPSVVDDLKRYDLITVRESLTLELLREKGISDNVRCVSDSAFLLDMEEVDLPNGFVPGNTVGINASPLILEYTDNKSVVFENYCKLVEHILESSDSSVVLVPHVVKDKNDDREVLKLIYEKFKDTSRVCLCDDCNCMQLKYIISKCRFFVGARTHATIAAYSTGVPTLVVGYSVKSRGIARDLFGTEENYVIPVQSLSNDDDLSNAFKWIFEREAEIREHLERIMPEYRERALSAKDIVKGLIK